MIFILRSGGSNNLERNAHVDVLAIADIADVLGIQHVFSAVYLHLHGVALGMAEDDILQAFRAGDNRAVNIHNDIASLDTGSLGRGVFIYLGDQAALGQYLTRNGVVGGVQGLHGYAQAGLAGSFVSGGVQIGRLGLVLDRKSRRLNSSHRL